MPVSALRKDKDSQGRAPKTKQNVQQWTGEYTLKTISTMISDRLEETEKSTLNHLNEPPLPMPAQSIVKEVIQQIEPTMHGIEPQDASNNVLLGPIPTSEVLLDLLIVQALFDTGSPITIVSLKCFLQAAVTNRATKQSTPQWAKAVQEQLKPSTVTLCSYGKDKLVIVSQVQCKLE